MAQGQKNAGDAMQEILEPQFQPLGQEVPLGWVDLLEEEMATHSSILAWRISWIQEPWQATVCGVAKESDTTKQLNNNLSSWNTVA